MRRDNKYPVSIRVYWQKQSAYINTEYYVTIYQINNNEKKGVFELKDITIIRELSKRIELFEKAKTEKLGIKIYHYTASELATYFNELITGKQDRIDFIEFGRKICEKRKKGGKNVSRIISSLNCLHDFLPFGKIYIHELTSKVLSEYESFLRTERKISRKNQLGKIVNVKHKPVSDTTIAGYMTDIRTIFNEAINEYNDDEKDEIRITHYPFKKYKFPVLSETRKRNISGEEILKILNVGNDELKLKRAILARDTFILSFLLVGMNFKDLYELQANGYKNGRITYKRAKTRGRRKDQALISIKIEPEVLPLIQKYKDPSGKRVFNFYNMYANSLGFVSSVDKGLKIVASACGMNEKLSSYYARHSWATIARNKCKISKSDVDECLNHVDNNSRMADIYIEKDWGFIDEANRKVIDFVYNNS
jgi:integrase